MTTPTREKLEQIAQNIRQELNKFYDDRKGTTDYLIAQMCARASLCIEDLNRANDSLAKQVAEQERELAEHIALLKEDYMSAKDAEARSSALLSQAQADARRYRYWRNVCLGRFIIQLRPFPEVARLRFDASMPPVFPIPNADPGEQCDAALDAALGPEEAKGCNRKLAPGQWWSFCGQTDMGQTSPVLCTECGGQYILAVPPRTEESKE